MQNIKLLEEQIREFKNLDFQHIEIDEIKTLLNKLMSGYLAGAPIFDAGITIYRAVKWINKPTKIQDCSYPPISLKNGRANRSGSSIF